MNAYLVSHLMSSTSFAGSVDYRSSSMDFHTKLWIPDETVAVHQNSLSNCHANSIVSGF